MAATDWFEVDREGLARVLERRGKSFIPLEILQNALDAPGTKNATVSIKRVAGTRRVELVVQDDSPTGFIDLSSAWRLFSASVKTGDAEMRGRFSAGEKLVLSMATSAEVISTTGGVSFSKEGRKRLRRTTETGTVFRCEIPMTTAEQEEAIAVARTVIAPEGIKTVINGEELPDRKPLASFNATLTTEIGDSEGVLRRSKRKTTIDVYEPWTDEPTLFEMGIPVTGSGCRWSVGVRQRLPLGLERDTVPSGYLVQLHALVVEKMRDHLSQADATSAWVREAMSKHADDLSDEAITKIVDLRFGPKRVIYDPSDAEANSLAIASGHQVVHGSNLSQAEWAAVKRSGAMLPAGRVTPSPRPFGASGKPLSMVPRERWTPEIADTVEYVARVSSAVTSAPVTVEVTSEAAWPFAAVYAPGRMILNLGRLGHAWFNRTREGNLERINALVIHELGHHDGGGDHLSKHYHDALIKVGAKMTALALAAPGMFR